MVTFLFTLSWINTQNTHCNWFTMGITSITKPNQTKPSGSCHQSGQLANEDSNTCGARATLAPDCCRCRCLNWCKESAFADANIRDTSGVKSRELCRHLIGKRCETGKVGVGKLLWEGIYLEVLKRPDYMKEDKQMLVAPSMYEPTYTKMSKRSNPFSWSQHQLWTDVLLVSVEFHTHAPEINATSFLEQAP